MFPKRLSLVVLAMFCVSWLSSGNSALGDPPAKKPEVKLERFSRSAGAGEKEIGKLVDEVNNFLRGDAKRVRNFENESAKLARRIEKLNKSSVPLNKRQRSALRDAMAATEDGNLVFAEKALAKAADDAEAKAVAEKRLGRLREKTQGLLSDLSLERHRKALEEMVNCDGSSAALNRYRELLNPMIEDKEMEDDQLCAIESILAVLYDCKKYATLADGVKAAQEKLAELSKCVACDRANVQVLVTVKFGELIVTVKYEECDEPRPYHFMMTSACSANKDELGCAEERMKELWNDEGMEVVAADTDTNGDKILYYALCRKK